MNKPFSSFFVKGSIKDEWKAAIRDPAYIGIGLILILWVIYTFFI